MNGTEEPSSGLAPVLSDAGQWREAARLRGKFRGWIVIWLASEGEFRAYRRMPGGRRDTALAAATADWLSAAIVQAEQAQAAGGAGNGQGQP